MYKYLKRLADFVTALILLPFLLMLTIIVTIIIKLDDGGRVFYCADRIGMHGRIFKMIKFRSMKPDSPDLRNKDGSTFNAEDDPRLTRAGRFLRKTSIDELPQLINILSGEMSFVGPRPILTDTPVSQFDDVRKKRVRVKPGITGYSQAFYRNSIPKDKKFELDCYYVDNISFMLDLKILFRTITSVIRRENVFIEPPSNTID